MSRSRVNLVRTGVWARGSGSMDGERAGFMREGWRQIYVWLGLGAFGCSMTWRWERKVLAGPRPSKASKHPHFCKMGGSKKGTFGLACHFWPVCGADFWRGYRCSVIYHPSIGHRIGHRTSDEKEENLVAVAINSTSSTSIGVRFVPRLRMACRRTRAGAIGRRSRKRDAAPSA